MDKKVLMSFLFGCILIRLSFVFLSYSINTKYLPLLGYLALLPAFGFLFLFVTGKRNKGFETGGKIIWWKNLRPLHALLYLSFAYFAIRKNPRSYIFLLVDVLLGLIAFTIYHTMLEK